MKGKIKVTIRGTCDYVAWLIHSLWASQFGNFVCLLNVNEQENIKNPCHLLKPELQCCRPHPIKVRL